MHPFACGESHAPFRMDEGSDKQDKRICGEGSLPRLPRLAARNLLILAYERTTKLAQKQ